MCTKSVIKSQHNFDFRMRRFKKPLPPPPPPMVVVVVVEGGWGAQWTSRPKLRISNKNTFYSFNFRSKNAPSGSKACLFDILYDFIL